MYEPVSVTEGLGMPQAVMTSATRRVLVVGLVGSGIETSLSPALHEQEAAQRGLLLTYQSIDLRDLRMERADVPQIIDWARRLGFRGLNVTYPGKRQAMEALDWVAPEARAIGSVNTIVFDEERRACGYNTDYTGFRKSFEAGLLGAPVTDVVIVGAGGAGSAAAMALSDLGAGDVHVVDSNAAAAEALVTLLAEHGRNGLVAHTIDDLPELVRGADGVVQATPVGMRLVPGTPFPPALLHSGLWLAEVIYRPVRTQLLIAAEQANCRVLSGVGMAVHQAAEAFELFTGVTSDAARMTAHMHELIQAETDAAS
jgi:shikimate dehydrogenase